MLTKADKKSPVAWAGLRADLFSSLFYVARKLVAQITTTPI